MTGSVRELFYEAGKEKKEDVSGYFFSNEENGRKKRWLIETVSK